MGQGTNTIAISNNGTQWAGLGTTALGGLGLLNNAGVLSGIKNLWPGSSSGGGNNITTTDTPIDTTVTQYVDPNEIGGAAGGLPKHFRTKSYASGGLVTLALDRAMRGAA